MCGGSAYKSVASDLYFIINERGNGNLLFIIHIGTIIYMYIGIEEIVNHVYAKKKLDC